MSRTIPRTTVRLRATAATGRSRPTGLWICCRTKDGEGTVMARSANDLNASRWRSPGRPGRYSIGRRRITLIACHEQAPAPEGR